MPSEPAAELPSWLEDLEVAGRAAATGISGIARAAVDKALTTSAIQAQICHEMLCDNMVIAPINAQEWHEFFKALYRITWRDLIPHVRVYATSKERESTSMYDAMLGVLNAIKDTARDALTAMDSFTQKPNRSNRKAAIMSVESACDALDAWRTGEL